MQINGIYFNGISTPIMVQNPKSRQFTTQSNDNQDVFVKSNFNTEQTDSVQNPYAPSFGARIPEEIAAIAKELDITNFKPINRLYYEPLNSKMLRVRSNMKGWYLSTTKSVRGEYYFSLYNKNHELAELAIISENEAQIIKLSKDKQGKIKRSEQQ